MGGTSTFCSLLLNKTALKKSILKSKYVEVKNVYSDKRTVKQH